MTPWWLRPYEEGASKDKTDSPSPETAPPSAPPDPDPSASGAAEPTPEAPASDGANAKEDSTSRATASRRGRGSRRRGADAGATEAKPSEADDAATVDRPADANEKDTDDDGKDEAAKTGRGKRAADRGDGKDRKKDKKKDKGGKRNEKSDKDDEKDDDARGRGKRNGKSERGGAKKRQPHAFDSEGDEPTWSAPAEVVYAVSADRSPSSHDERTIALFCDLENIALGVRDSANAKKFEIGLVLARLADKGKVIVKKAYCDWERYNEFKRPFHEAAVELIDIPQKYYSGKNSADIKMVVDALDLCYTKEHVDTFVILSGDSDFSPLVSKLRENNKYVIGIGLSGSSSSLLIDNCDEFLFYEDIWRDRTEGPTLDGVSPKAAKVYALVIDAIKALLRENKDVIWGSMIKQTIQRKKPSFNEGYYGYSTFSELLEAAEQQGILKLKKDRRSGTYVVTGFGTGR